MNISSTANPKEQQAKIHSPFKIECDDFNHKNEFVEYILLKQHIHNDKSRLLCRKCLATKFSQNTHEVCLIQDIINNPFNVFKFTNFQGNTNQILCDLIYSYDFTYNQDAIRFKIDEIKQSFLHQLSKLESQLLSSYEKYENVKSSFENLQNQFIQYFDISDLQNNLSEAEKKFESITPKDKQKLKKVVNNYVERLFLINQKEKPDLINNLKTSIDYLKTKLAQNQDQLRFLKSNLDSGLQNILKEVKNMEQTFSTLKLRQSELSTDYVDQLIAKINPDFQMQNNVQNRIKKIYQSKYDGLDSKQVFDKITQLGQFNTQKLLFMFKTSSQQIFGVWVDQNSTQIFQQNKQQEFYIKSNIAPLTLNFNNNPEKLMTFGKDDIIIKSSFISCSSNLGEGFQINPTYQIGNLQTYLANQRYFDIVEMEIFQIHQ